MNFPWFSLHFPWSIGMTMTSCACRVQKISKVACKKISKFHDFSMMHFEIPWFLPSFQIPWFFQVWKIILPFSRIPWFFHDAGNPEAEALALKELASWSWSQSCFVPMSACNFQNSILTDQPNAARGPYWFSRIRFPKMKWSTVEPWNVNRQTDRRKAMHKSPPCISTGGLKISCKTRVWKTRRDSKLKWDKFCGQNVIVLNRLMNISSSGNGSK